MPQGKSDLDGVGEPVAEPVHLPALRECGGGYAVIRARTLKVVPFGFGNTGDELPVVEPVEQVPVYIGGCRPGRWNLPLDKDAGLIEKFCQWLRKHAD